MGDERMWGKAIKEMKQICHPAIVTVLGAALLLAGGWWWLGQSLPDSNLQTAGIDALPNDPVPTQSAILPERTTASPTPTPIAQAEPTTPPIAQAPVTPGSNVGRSGGLRISNPTDYPIRVAVLAKKTASTPESVTTDNSYGSYEPPAHWDFEPGEGAAKGLIVSLPDRKLKVNKGDIVVAFAQDGSRRYWGPYVIGDTPSPRWNPKGTEWLLVLDP
ncbi:hypothetical protein ACN4EK_15860 [Pantanalinema rosaneae CENA516]|uniref:hypothetical protein n=1 Tax=Pantanalinema rosaneae TaxID=1620701 RepID=UPI003D6F8A17